MKRERGFTLVEVVVAFLLLALVLVTVFEIFTTGLARAGELEHYSRALAIAQGELASAGVEDALAEGEMRGETDDHQFHWTVTVKQHVDADAATAAQQAKTVTPYTLYRVGARVAWQAATGAEREVALATLVVQQNK